MGVNTSRPPDQCSSNNLKMDAYIEAVDDMAISKVKRELKSAGIDPDACVRERLKEERRKTWNGESAPERGSSIVKTLIQRTLSRCGLPRKEHTFP